MKYELILQVYQIRIYFQWVPVLFAPRHAHTCTRMVEPTSAESQMHLHTQEHTIMWCRVM